jgi:hypothetical protein
VTSRDADHGWGERPRGWLRDVGGFAAWLVPAAAIYLVLGLAPDFVDPYRVAIAAGVPFGVLASIHYRLASDGRRDRRAKGTHPGSQDDENEHG